MFNSEVGPKDSVSLRGNDLALRAVTSAGLVDMLVDRGAQYQGTCLNSRWTLPLRSGTGRSVSSYQPSLCVNVP